MRAAYLGVEAQLIDQGGRAYLGVEAQLIDQGGRAYLGVETQLIDQGGRARHPAQPQTRRQDLREAVKPQDASVDIKRQQARQPLGLELQVVVRVVLEDQQVVDLSKPIQALPALHSQAATRRVGSGRDGVDDTWLASCWEERVPLSQQSF